MKQLYLLSIGLTLVWCVQSKASLVYRSQSQNSARDIAGGLGCFPLDACSDTTCTQLSALFEYTQSFRPGRLIKNWFGVNNQRVGIEGSQIENRCTMSWLADYFGLPPDFQSVICFSPKIQNYIIDCAAYHQWDICEVPLFIEVHVPLVHSNWDLNYKETVLNRGVQGFEGGYFTDGFLPREFLLNSFTEFVRDQKVPALINGLELYQAFLGSEITARNAVIFDPLLYSKWSSCLTNTSKTKVSDVHFDIGTLYAHSDCITIGAALHLAFPTGNQLNNEFVFEPLVGNGHHWELGARVIGYANLGEVNCDTTVAFLFDGMVSHLFSTTQCRVFDLCGRGCVSRYMLAQRMGTPVEKLFAHSGQMVQDGALAPSAQFYSRFAPVANLTFQQVRVSARVKTDISCAFRFTHDPLCLKVDCGYNFWFRSKDSISFKDCTFEDEWVLKGDSHVFGFTNIDPCPGTCPIANTASFGSAIPLSPSQHCACITTGRNYPLQESGTGVLRPSQNPGVDNPSFAQDMPNASGALPLLDRFPPEQNGLPIQTSFDPIFLTLNDLNCATCKGLSHKLFVALRYDWEADEICPFISVGSEVEFGKNSNNCSCEWNTYCSVSQWGAWLKGGVVF